MALDNELIYNDIALHIILRQKDIIGPVAFTQADAVKGLSVKGTEVNITDKNKKKVLKDLVYSYSDLFGRASIEVCKDAVNGMKDIDDKMLPSVLV